MPGIAVVGMQWGDEGKARIVDLLTEESDIVARTGGGSNAGHTVVIGNDIFRLHLIPVGVLHPNKLSVIATGVVFDPSIFIEELENLEARGFPIGENLLISDRCHIVFPFHKAMDRLSEARKGTGKLGTTGRGIGPCYADKSARVGIRLAEMLSGKPFKESLKRLVEEKNLLFRAHGLEESWDADALYEEYSRYAERLRPLVGNSAVVLNHALDEGKQVLFEGAQGTLLDLDYGTYPFVTSSNASVLGVCAGAGISPKRLTKITGVVKAYTTRVGEGPFPTELTDARGEHLRTSGKEFGTTTGRPRRCGWLDLVALKYTTMLNGVDALALTKLDILSGLDPLFVCVAYRVAGERIEEFPAEAARLSQCEPVYQELPGWKEAIGSVTSFSRLPKEAQNYVRYIEEALAVPVEMISIGPERNQNLRIR